MNEAETRAELIDPHLKACGWGVVDDSKILREYHTKSIFRKHDICNIKYRNETKNALVFYEVVIHFHITS